MRMKHNWLKKTIADRYIRHNKINEKKCLNVSHPEDMNIIIYIVPLFLPTPSAIARDWGKRSVLGDVGMGFVQRQLMLPTNVH